jgi:hypothetical protein
VPERVDYDAELQNGQGRNSSGDWLNTALFSDPTVSLFSNYLKALNAGD